MEKRFYSGVVAIKFAVGALKPQNQYFYWSEKTRKIGEKTLFFLAPGIIKKIL